MAHCVCSDSAFEFHLFGDIDHTTCMNTRCMLINTGVCAFCLHWSHSNCLCPIIMPTHQ